MKSNVTVDRGRYPGLFGGMGFHNSEACMYGLMEPEHFNQVVCKTYREISPGFMRAFAGFSDWTQEAMDLFACYYEQMQGWTDTPMYLTPGRGKLHFSREEKVRYAQDVADRLAYLVFEKNVRHIRYYCFSNEMSQIKWGALLNNLPLFREYHELLYQAFQNKGLNIGLLATDSAGVRSWNTIDWAMDNMPAITAGYCVHHYERKFGIDDPDFYDWFRRIYAELSAKVMAREERRVILGEYGINTPSAAPLIGARTDLCQYLQDERSAHSCLMLCEMALAAINAGVYALALWTFCDYPDPYGCAYGKEGWNKAWGEAERFLGWGTDVRYNKWGMTKWEDNGDYSARDSYWSVGLLTKFMKGNSKLLTITTDDPLLRIAGVMNRDRTVSIGIVNRHDQPADTRIVLGFATDRPFRRYEYDANNVPSNRFADLQDYTDMVKTNGEDALELVLLPQSLTVLTTDYRERDRPVEAQGLVMERGVLSWKAVGDPGHCYYRVYRGDSPDFTPAAGNQAASTIAESIPIGEEASSYRVFSVDRWGNCL